MPWDVNSFLKQLTGGFEAGQLKRDEQDQATLEQQKIAQEGANGELKQQAGQSDLEFKAIKNKISLLQSLVKLFDSGKKKKNADGTEIDEPNPVLELLKKSFEGAVGGGYDNPVAEVASQPQPNMMPQSYTPEPQADPYMAPVKRNSVATTTNDIVGNIANGGQEYMNSGNLEDYLKRYLQ